MKRIDNLRELEPFGIDALTGESDAHCYRILFDVTKRGQAIIERTMDVQLTLHDPWNSGHVDDPHIGSLLLPLEFIPSIAVFCLLTDTSIAEVWLLKRGMVLGFSVEDVDQKDALRKHYEGELRNVFYPRPSDRNIHQFTQRTA